MNIELNEQQIEFLKFLIQEEVLGDLGSIFDETSKVVAQQIITKLETE